MKSTQFHTFKSIMNFLRNWRKPNEFFKRMKKQYLLALIAAPFFCAASVNAQGIQPKLEGRILTSDVLQSNVQQTKATENSLLPDSVITEQNGVLLYKSVYTHLGEGKDYVVNNLGWSGKSWIPFSKKTVMYDEQGREVRSELISETGVSPKQHQLINTEYENDRIYVSVEDTTWIEDSKYRYSVYLVTKSLDKHGNVISEEYSNEVGEKYMFQKVQMEYNTDNQMTGKMTIQYNQEGKEVARYRETWTWKGNTDAYEFMEVSNDGGSTWKFYAEYKAETTGENPVIVTRATNMKSKEDPEWVIEKLTYYYPNSSTANESIESEAAVRIYTQEGSIVVDTENAEPVTVYSITGKCCYNATATGMITINNLQAGIYIVRVGDKTLKVRVR